SRRTRRRRAARPAPAWRWRRSRARTNRRGGSDRRSRAHLQEIGERGGDVAAGEDEAVDAGLAQGRFERAGAAGDEHARAAGGLERTRGIRGVGGVALVAATEAGDGGALARRRR